MSDFPRPRDELLEENRRLRAILARRRRAANAERKKNAEGDELFRRLFRLSPVGKVLTRAADSVFTDANPEFCRLVGYDREQLLGRSGMEMGMWKNPERREELRQRLSAEDIVQDFECTIIRADGNLLELNGSFQLLTVDGELTILSVLTDIGARKRVERSLREAKREAERAREEAEDLARFRSSVVTNVTHEVRTPLTVILGFTSILREGVEDSHRRFVDLIERSGQRLLMTLDSVLDLAQLESGTLEVEANPRNVLDVVDSMANATRSIAEEKSLAFETELPAKALYAEVDDELLARALRHLVDNAVKFTDEGRVVLRVREEEGTDGEGPGRVLIEVEDTGIGIAEEFLPQLFGPFSQESSGMERDYQGSGVGLTVTSQLVERLGGKLEVESCKGEGSTFTVVLPRVERAASVGNPFRTEAA